MMLAKDEFDFITTFRSLTPENQDKVLRLGEAMLAKQEAAANPIDIPHHNTVQCKRRYPRNGGNDNVSACDSAFPVDGLG